MRLRPPLRVSVTRHEEKEHSLKEFLRHHIVVGQEERAADQRTYDLLIVARSLESPVIKAIGTLADEIVAAGLAVRLILAQLDRDLNAADWAFAHEIRWAKHPRLIEAHEQLVIDPETCWIGDCMRRDPAKCDAYESFVENCGEAAGCATVSFERLWLASQPLVKSALRRASLPPPPGVASPDGDSQPTVGTRH
jgi:hypothetical protein